MDGGDELVRDEKSTTFSLEERIKELQSSIKDLASQIETYITQTTMKSSGSTYEAMFAKGSYNSYNCNKVHVPCDNVMLDG